MTLHFNFQAFTPLQFQRDSLYVIPLPVAVVMYDNAACISYHSREIAFSQANVNSG